MRPSAECATPEPPDHSSASGGRADSGFYTHPIVAACRNKGVRFSITVRQHQTLRNLIEAIPEADWTPIPYWMAGAADAAETIYTPFASEPDAVPVRLIIRRVKPTPGSQLALFANYSYHAFITDREGDTLDLEADHRRHAEIENAIRDLKYGVGLNHLPSGRFPANAAWLAVQVMAHPPLAEHAGRRASGWASRWSPPRPSDDASSLCPDASPAKHAGSPCIFPRTGPGKISSALPWRDCAPCRSLPDRRPRRLIVRRAAAQICARLVTQCPLLQFALIISPAGPAEGRQHPLGVATTSCAQLD